jgi:hypothetical protein
MNQKLLGFTPYTLDEREHLRNWVDQAKASHGSGIEAGVSTGYPSFRYLAGGMPTSRLKAL